MKKGILLVLLCVFVQVVKAQVQTIEIASLDTIAEKDFLLIDVRTPEEFAEGHIPGAINIDVKNEDFTEKIATISKEEAVYLYCKSGGRSTKATTILSSLGYENITNLSGGFEAWKTDDKIYMKDL